jgi:hypothetical protein
MNKRIMVTIGIGLTLLLLAAVFATSVFAHGPGGGFNGMQGGRAESGYGGMMMGGWSPSGHSGMMGGQPGCASAAGAWGVSANAQPITFDTAAQAVQNYLNSYGNADLTLAEVMEFDNNVYAVVTEKITGTGAFEVLVNRYTGVVHPEPGPNMMWNTRYSHTAGPGSMMGRMGGVWNQQTSPLTVTVAQARTTAQQWLDASQPGARMADDEMQFYGYYTMDFFKDGKTAGMLSVNGYSGQVWHHTWHGNFISEQEF